MEGECAMNEGILTGEATPMMKKGGDQDSILYKGTMCLDGDGVCVVY
jgi:high-affinity K+ transport system ATPase subunit B